MCDCASAVTKAVQHTCAQLLRLTLSCRCMYMQARCALKASKSCICSHLDLSISGTNSHVLQCSSHLCSLHCLACHMLDHKITSNSVSQPSFSSSPHHITNRSLAKRSIHTYTADKVPCMPLPPQWHEAHIQVDVCHSFPPSPAVSLLELLLLLPPLLLCHWTASCLDPPMGLATTGRSAAATAALVYFGHLHLLLPLPPLLLLLAHITGLAIAGRSATVAALASSSLWLLVTSL